MWRSVLRLTFFCALVMLFFARNTAADLFVNKRISQNVWAATTLDFSSQDTANNQTTNSLFTINGLVGNGFQVKSLRIKNQGQTKSSFWISAEKTGGSQDLYENLKIKIMKNWQIIYEGSLTDMQLHLTATSDITDEDLIIAISLNRNDSQVMHQESHFNLILKTNENNTQGLFVEKKLENFISTDG